MRICVYGASSNAIDAAYIEAGERLGRLLGECGHSLVFGGGASGMMGAAARGMTAAGGEIVGVVPRFFNADGILYEHCTAMHRTDTMRERKQLLEDLSDAFVMTAGGVGTYDEFFEMLTLRQLGRTAKPLIVLNTNGYFDALQKMLLQCVEQGFMRAASLSLYRVCATPEEVLAALEETAQTADIAAHKFI